MLMFHSAILGSSLAANVGERWVTKLKDRRGSLKEATKRRRGARPARIHSPSSAQKALRVFRNEQGVLTLSRYEIRHRLQAAKARGQRSGASCIGLPSASTAHEILREPLKVRTAFAWRVTHARAPSKAKEGLNVLPSLVRWSSVFTITLGRCPLAVRAP
jgi:hypothetical protein